MWPMELPTGLQANIYQYQGPIRIPNLNLDFLSATLQLLSALTVSRHEET